ncbi:MAG: OmpA family protein [Verrucomicrobiota bacterium]
MKNLKFCLFIALCAFVALGTGCRKGPSKGITKIPGERGDKVGDGGPADLASKPPGPGTGSSVGTPTVPITTEVPPGGVPLSDPGSIMGMIPDPAIFAAQTVYFDFDKAVVKASERPKVQVVAERLRQDSQNKLMIYGHCDERGTEEYNRALGERRALALREYLITLGIGPDRVFTRSYGEDKPALEGHDEAAWSKNRRGEFILLTPKP